MSAIGTLLAEGERFDDVVNAVNAITPVPGRMEVFLVTGAANLVVDYAHTPDALEKVLLSAKFHTTGKVWCVFGCGGDRDKGKRPLMGQAAEVGADAIVITTDNSRSESPESIAEDIIAGLKNRELAVSIPDREQAIRHCLEHAHESDIIIVAEKAMKITKLSVTKRLTITNVQLWRDCNRVQQMITTTLSWIAEKVNGKLLKALLTLKCLQ